MYMGARSFCLLGRVNWQKKNCQGVQTRHMGLKNVPKKFGTPGLNLAPNLFGFNRGLLLFSFWKRAESDCLHTRLKGG